jgi:hypothetical protein
MTKYLIFDASTEHESFVGVVECTPEYLAQIKKRMELATKASDEDDDFSWMLFSDSADLYYRTPSVNDWIEANGPEDDFDFDATRVMVTETKPEFHEIHRVRVSLTYLQVDESACFWELLPKHSDQSCQSQVVRADDALFTE